MGIKKNLSGADIQVLGEAELRRRKATQGTCPNCFLKAKLTPMGVCQDCDDAVRPATRQEQAPEPEATSSTLRRYPYDETKSWMGRATYTEERESRTGGGSRTIYKLEGPKHSPAYLGSCAQHTAPENPSNLEPHPNALGTLPINATLDDYEHYAAARGGRVLGGVMHVDLRTPEQRDPSHRSYVPTPMLVSQKINHNPTRPTSKDNNWGEDAPKITTWTEYTTQKDFHINAWRAHELLEDARARLTPEELEDHNIKHGGILDSDSPGQRDEKGIPWRNKPDTCPLCRAVEQVKTAEYEHDTGQHTRDVHPLCPKC